MFENLFSRSGLSLDRLRSLVETEEAGGIAAAAPDDPVRQSQISRNLAELEKFFGTELKRRAGKGIELTHQGRQLAAMARLHLRGLEDFAKASEQRPVEVRIGASQSVLEGFVVPFLSEAAEKETRANFVLRSMRSHEIVSGLNDFSIDLGIVRESAISSKRLQRALLASVRYVLIAPTKLAARFDHDAIALIGKAPLATSMGGEYRGAFDSFVSEKEIAPDIRFACSSFRTALELLRRSDRIAAVLPDSVVGELDPKKFVALDLPFSRRYERKLVVAWHERIDDLRPGVRAWREGLITGGPGI